MRFVHKTMFWYRYGLFCFCQTKQVCAASEEEEKTEEVKIKEELFHDESDEEKLVEDEPVFDTHNHQKNEKAK